MKGGVYQQKADGSLEQTVFPPDESEAVTAPVPAPVPAPMPVPAPTPTSTSN